MGKNYLFNFYLQNIAIPRFQSQVIKFYQETGVELYEPNDLDLPIQFNLLQNYPNPFNSNTIINYSIHRNDYVTLNVYNLLGNEVTTLVNEFQVARDYSVRWDSENLPSGIYFIRLQSGNSVKTRKMIIL